jgi:uncharacterized CHY-type Zn-finger protein
MADDEIDAMLDDLYVGGTPGLPSQWNVGKKPETFTGPRNDRAAAQDLLSNLNRPINMPSVVVPTTAPVKVSTAGVCARCNKDITDHTYQTVERVHVYHNACFVCSKCHTPITGGLERTGTTLTCAQCVRLPTCWRCRKTVALTDRFVETDDHHHYHSPGCITCGKCQCALDMNEVFFARGDMFCKKCF